ncbi:MAG: D-2-hydroxyacid dehydrogenase [Tepidisphaeraceae bacterium]
MKIVALDGYTLNPGDNPWDPVQRLGELVVYDRSSAEEVITRADGADALITNKVPFDSKRLDALPKLKLICVSATGYNIIDTAAARARNVSVCNVPEYGTNSVAQFVFALLLELAHRAGDHSRGVHDGQWVRSPDWCYWVSPQIELAGLRLGIVGFGRIGRRVGELAHALGMEVLATRSASGKPAPEPGYDRFRWVASTEELFAESDVVSLHCPLTAQNTGMINGVLLSRMKRSALLINTARGGLVVEKDLAEALNAGTIAGAALDVISAEPMKADNPLRGARNCVITPHVAWATLAARKRLMEATARNIAMFKEGRPVNVVNP